MKIAQDKEHTVKTYYGRTVGKWFKDRKTSGIEVSPGKIKEERYVKFEEWIDYGSKWWYRVHDVDDQEQYLSIALIKELFEDYHKIYNPQYRVNISDKNHIYIAKKPSVTIK